ncbi:hypothetical protein KSF78_0003830 [Schistosoma japonicum]|nr:hypothetical protein KSF78_0003830 [Schistosoma japonicum]
MYAMNYVNINFRSQTSIYYLCTYHQDFVLLTQLLSIDVNVLVGVLFSLLKYINL